MQYELNEDQMMFQDMVRRLTKEKIAPRAAEIDAEGKFPHDIYDILCENRLLGISFPEEFGGAGADFLTFCLAVEEISAGCLNSAMILGIQELASMPLLIACSQTQKETYLPKLASGEWLGSFCLTEPGAGSDAAAMSSKAIRKDDVYVINGSKCFISEADQAKLFTVFAKTDPDKGFEGISAFIVERDFPGISVGKNEDKMGTRGIASCEVIFENCEVPVSNLLGNEGDGIKIAFQTLDKTRPLVGAAGVGLAQGAIDYAIEYAKTRIQFNKPIASFQGIQFRLADLAMQVEAARQLVYKAAANIDKMDREKSWNKSKEKQMEVSKLGAMAKCFATDIGMKSALEAALVLGGYGYIKDYPMERHIRDARLLQIVEGTNDIQRLVIAEALFA